MKKLFTLLFFVVLTTLTFAQNNYQDVVYLKNGSIIRGIIIEQIPNKSIKIETADRSVFVFQMDEIERFTKEPVQGRSPMASQSGGLQKGYRGILETGIQAGYADYGMDRLKVDYINAYQFNPYISLGFGTGFRYYFDADAILMPFTADFRVNFIKFKVTPFIGINAGYAFDVTNGFEGVGEVVAISAGVNFAVSDRNFMHVALGIDSQAMEFYDYNWGYDTFTEVSNAITLNLGLSF